MYRNIISSVFFLFILVSSNAQTAANQHVLNLFKNPRDVQWVKHYKGRMDDTNDVALILAYDGKICRGKMEYLRSQETFSFEGEMQGNTLLLQELDQQEAVSGFFIAKMKNDQLEGEWSNFDGSIGAMISVNEVDPSAELTLSNCGDNKWIRLYSGIIMWDEVEMTLHRLGSNTIRGTMYYKNQDEFLTVDGTMTDEGDFSLKFKNSGGIKVGMMMGRENERHELRAEYFDKSGERQFASFEVDSRLSVSCVQYADYMTSYEIIYPESTHKSFNKWMDKTMEVWVNRCRKQVKYMKKKHEVEDPSLRASQRAYIWFDIEHLTDNLISGSLTYSSTWSSQNQGEPINFNLEEGEEIQWNDIFKKNKKFKVFLKKYIQEKLMRNPRYTEQDFRNWVKKESFPLFTVCREGICFSTNFNPIYGQPKVIVPFTLLKPYMRKNSPIDDLLD